MAGTVFREVYLALELEAHPLTASIRAFMHDRAMKV
jgi:hypothetical protein